MARRIHFFILFIILNLRNCDFLCTISQNCPADKPFCSDRGCLYECPKSAYINGTRCVVECGNWFVDNRTCIQQCPPERFIRETPKLAGRDIFIEKRCVNSCSSREYVFDNTCVRACPVTHIYISERQCSTNCPESAPFMTNLTTNKYITYRCESQCSHFVENEYCTDHCSDHLNIFNNTCISVCPGEYHLIFEQKCVSKCPDSTIYVNDSECMTKCPLEKPYLNNGSCVSGCAQGFKTVKNKIWHCVESCNDEMFIYNQTCVSTCPSGYVVNSNTCDENCSAVLPYSCEVINNPRENCGATALYRIYPQQKYITCVKQCPDNMYILNSSCVYSCPASFYYLGRKCAQSCSTDLPFLYNETSTPGCNNFICSNLITKLTCIEACPSDTYSFKRFCYSRCPAGLYTSGKTCTTTCSDFFTKKNTVTLGTYERYSKPWITGWRKKNVKATIVECVAVCGHGYFQYNTTCVKECPRNINYVTNGTCHAYICDTKYMYNKSEYIECSDICEEGNYIYKRQCVKNCPEHTFLYNRTCVTLCPSGSPYENNSKYWITGWRKRNVKATMVECVAECGPEYFQYNTTCVKECPRNINYVTNRTCHANICDTKYMYNKSKYIECSDICEEGNYIHKKQCVKNCPEHTFLYNRTCVTLCPSRSPFIQNQATELFCQTRSCRGNNKLCVEKCSNDTFALNKTCVSRCPMHTFVYNYTCVSKCPENSYFPSKNNLVFDPSKVGRECLIRCPQGTFVLNQTCVTKCPEGTFALSNNSCVYECPNEKPLEYRSFMEHWTCIDSCDADQVYENGDCTYSCTEPKIPFGGKCIQQCPEGYIWFEACGSISSVMSFSILFFVIPEITILFLGRKILKEYFTVVWMALRCRIFESEEDEESVSEEVENEVENDVTTSDLEMQVCSDEQLQLLS